VVAMAKTCSKVRFILRWKKGIGQKPASRLMTCHLRAALLPKQGINIFAPGNLGVRMDEMIAPLALAHDRACLVESLS